MPKKQAQIKSKIKLRIIPPAKAAENREALKQFLAEMDELMAQSGEQYLTQDEILEEKARHQGGVKYDSHLR